MGDGVKGKKGVGWRGWLFACLCLYDGRVLDERRDGMGWDDTPGL